MSVAKDEVARRSRPVGCPLHDEVGEGDRYHLSRRPSGLDADELQARLDRHREDR